MFRHFYKPDKHPARLDRLYGGYEFLVHTSTSYSTFLYHRQLITFVTGLPQNLPFPPLVVLATMLFSRSSHSQSLPSQITV